MPSTDSRPRILVTRKLPDAVEHFMMERFDCSFNPDDVPMSQAMLRRAMSQYDALLATITDRIDRSVIEARARRVKMIANFGAGCDHIDLEAVQSAGLLVSNTPDALTEATAEVALTLMLMAARRASEGERELREGGWAGWRPTHMMGQGLAGKTLALLGFGKIAQATAVRAEAFGMKTVFYTRSPCLSDRAERVSSLDILADRADILSIHVPGGLATKHLINATFLQKMKPTAIFINTARGSVVDENALAEALRRREIAAAGLDVYEFEPTINAKLLACSNAVLLPHLGSATIETRTAMGMQAVDNLMAFFAGLEVPNRVGL